MKAKRQDKYVPLDRAVELLTELLAPRLLKGTIEALKTSSKDPSEVFGELEFLFEDIEEVLNNRLETSLARIEALTVFLGVDEYPKEVSDASILKAKTAALQFSRAIGAAQETINALEQVFSRANSDMITAEARASIEDLAQTLEEAIETVRNSLKKWKEQRENILTELLKDDSEVTQKVIKAGLKNGINALLGRLALDGVIDSRLTHIDALSADTRNFIMTEIVK